MGTKIMHLGGPGLGQTAKLCNNLGVGACGGGVGAVRCGGSRCYGLLLLTRPASGVAFLKPLVFFSLLAAPALIPLLPALSSPSSNPNPPLPQSPASPTPAPQTPNPTPTPQPPTPSRSDGGHQRSPRPGTGPGPRPPPAVRGHEQQLRALLGAGVLLARAWRDGGRAII